MRPFTARLALAALVPALLVLSIVPGCSNQSEGERCGDDQGNVTGNDCAAGLVCTMFKLSDGLDTARCCYTDHVTDSRCLMSSGVSATSTPSGGASSSTSEAGAAGVSDAIGGGGGSVQMTPDRPAGAGGT